MYKSWKQDSTNSSCTATFFPSLKLSKLYEQDVPNTTKKVKTSSKVTFLYGPLHTDEQVLDDQLKNNYNSYVRTQDVV